MGTVDAMMCRRGRWQCMHCGQGQRAHKGTGGSVLAAAGSMGRASSKRSLDCAFPSPALALRSPRPPLLLGPCSSRSLCAEPRRAPTPGRLHCASRKHPASRMNVADRASRSLAGAASTSGRAPGSGRPQAPQRASFVRPSQRAARRQGGLVVRAAAGAPAAARCALAAAAPQGVGWLEVRGSSPRAAWLCPASAWRTAAAVQLHRAHRRRLAPAVRARRPRPLLSIPWLNIGREAFEELQMEVGAGRRVCRWCRMLGAERTTGARRRCRRCHPACSATQPLC